MVYPNFTSLKQIYNNQINLILSSTGLTTRCDFNFGVTNTNVCPNCIYDVGLKKSSGKYKIGGPIPFALGKICPYCNGIGSYGTEHTSTGYLAIIWNYKKWINPPPNIANPEGYIQTICHRDYLSSITQCKDMTVIYNEEGSNPIFQLYGEPNPAGLGDNEYLFCMWKKIGVNNSVPSTITTSPLPTGTYSWSQFGNDIDGEAANDYSGFSVSLNNAGDIVAIGAIYNDNGVLTNSGHVRVYYKNGSNWTQRGSDINGVANNDNSGFSVSLNGSGNIVAIGSPYNDTNGSNSGKVKVYKWSGSNWIQLGLDINGGVANDLNGYSVSLNDDGSILAIGSIYGSNTAVQAGITRVYAWNGSSWYQLGSDINGEAAYDYSGYSVSINNTGDMVAIGAIFNDGTSLSNSGHVRIYYWNGSAWIKLGNDIDGEAINDESGYSVSINGIGNIVAIGARYNDANGTDSGSTRVYIWDGSSWIKRGNDIDGEANGDNSGYSVSLNTTGDILAIGARYNDGNGSNSGHVRIYGWNGSAWIQQGSDINGENSGDYSGWSVSLNATGNILAIGSVENDGGGFNSGSARIYKTS